MASTRTIRRDSATLRVQGWDGSSLVAGTLGGADPLGFAAGDANLYRYVGNDPINDVDPTGLQQKTGEDKPKGATVTEISEQVINELLEEIKKNGSLPKDYLTFPGYEKYDVGGPCAQYASRMTKLLASRHIEYKVVIYDIDGDKFYTVNYTSPDGKIIPVDILARRHVVVVVETDSGTLRFDAGVGVDPIRDNITTVGQCSAGNFGDKKTGVIAPKNSNPKVTGPSGGKTKVGQPILKPVAR
jgi:hypothetical protein